MARRGNIDELYDLEKIQQQQNTVIGYVTDFIKIINEIKPITMKLEGVEKTKDVVQGISQINEQTVRLVKTTNMAVNAMGDLVKSSKFDFSDQTKGLNQLNDAYQTNLKQQLQLKLRLEEIKKSQKEVTDSYKAGATGAQDYIDKITSLNSEQGILQESLKEVGKLVQSQAKEISKAVLTPGTPFPTSSSPASGTTLETAKEKELAKLNDEYEKAKILAKNLTDIYKEGSEQSMTALKKVEELGKQIDQIKNPPPLEVEVKTKLVDTGNAFDALKVEYKEAIKNAEDLATRFGIQDERAIEAAKSAGILKQRIDEVNASIKAGGAAQPQDVPFTNNLADLEKERQSLEKTGEVVSDLDKEQADAAMTANEWAAAQAVVAQESKKTADGFERVKIPLEEYTGSLLDNVKKQQSYKERLSEIKSELTGLKNSYTDAEKSTDSYKSKVAALLQEQVELKIASSELGHTINAQVKYTQAAEGSYDQLNAVLGLSRDLLRQMSEEEKASPFGQQLSKNVDELDAKLKAQDAKMGNYFRNVGNYAKASAAPLAILQKALVGVRDKLNDPALTGQQLQKLQEEEQLLTQFTENLNKQFTSTRTEMRAMQEVAKQLGINFGTTSEVFLEFTDEVGDAKDKLDDIQNVINHNASDTKYLDSALNAAQGLAGAYGAVQGAIQLTGGSTDDLQKSMVKLQAILTIINGLQAIQNVLQAESGVIQTILATKIGLVNAAKVVEAALFTQTAVAVEAEAIAQAENVVATEAAVVAQAENIAVTEASTVAMEGQVVATEAATVATTTLRTALLASGIGAAFLAIAAGVVYLVKKVNDWVLADAKAIERQNELGKAIKETNDNIIDQANLIKQTDTITRRNLQNQLDLENAAGTTQVRQFALRKQIAQEDQNLAQSQVDFLGATNKQQSQLLSSIESGKAKIGLLNQKLQKEIAAGDEHGAEATRKAIEGFQIDVDSNTSLFQAGMEARNSLFQANKDLAQLQNEQDKFNADERRKLILESTRIEADLLQSKNDKILSDERSTLKERLNALRSNLEAQKKIIEAEKNAVLSDPTTSAVDKTLAIKKAAQQEQKVRMDINERIFQENEKERLRNLQAQKTILEIDIDQNIDANKKITSDLNQSLSTRLAAFKTYIQDQQVLADADYKLKLQQAGISDGEIAALDKDATYKVKRKKITDAELQALQKQHENAILKIGIDGQNDFLNVLKGELDKQQELREEKLNGISRLYDKLNADTSKKYGEDVIELNNSFLKKEISHKKYLERRAIIDAQYQIKSSASRITELQQEIALFEDAGNKEVAARKRVEDLKKQLSKANNDDDRKTLSEKLDLAKIDLKNAEDNAKKKEAFERELQQTILDINKDATDKLISNREKLLELEKQLADQLLTLFQTSVDSGYDKQNQEIEEQIKLLEKRTQVEIDGIERSALSQQDKADKIKVLQEKEAIQKQQLEEKEKQNNIKKARFDRTVQIARITGSQIEAVSNLRAEAAITQAKATELLAESFANPRLAPAAAAMQAAAGFITSQIPVTIALGAAQIATLLAAGIPGYAEGITTDEGHPGGLAILGDGGKEELVVEPTGRQYLSDNKPQLVDLPKGSKVYPDASQVIGISLAEQHQRTLSMAAYEKPNDYYQMQTLSNAIDKGFNKLNKTILEKKETHITIENPIRKWVTDGHSSFEYL
jgi:hypothetical protein